MTRVLDADGESGRLEAPFSPGAPAEVRLASGARLRLAAGLVEESPDGTLHTRVAFADLLDDADAPPAPPEPTDTQTFQEIRESLKVRRVVHDVERVRVTVSTGTTEETVRESVWSEAVNVRREAVGEVVTEVEDIRTESGVTIVPIYEEVLVVERRLVLRERLHVSVRREASEHTETVPLRHQSVEVERLEPDNPLPGDDATEA